MFPLALTILVPACLVLACNCIVLGGTRRFTTSRLEDLPTTPTILVLGCAPWVATGKDNFYFEARIAAAHVLYQAWPTCCVIVSGGNLTRSQRTADLRTEPDVMKAALVARGVPSHQIVLDTEGHRTRLSLERARHTFGVTKVVIVSQPFHTPRAVYLGRTLGLEAYGYEAATPSVASFSHLRIIAREWVARTRAALGF